MVSLLGGRASGGSVTVRGGHRLRKFITDFEGLTNQRVAQLMAGILRQVLLPALRSRAIVRTGNLQRSLKIVQRGEGINLEGAFYGRFAKAAGTNRTIVDEAMDIIESRRDEIRARLKEAIRRELGI